jgi:ABC-type multidrug transport system fused ATPase/permease subunit
MTVTNTAEKTLHKNEETKPERTIDKKGTTGAVLRRLTAYMSSGEATSKFVLGIILRFVALLALVTLPFITGQAMNVINEGGATDELLQWVIYGAIAGLIFLVMSFVADRAFASLATKALYRLQTELFSNLQTLSMGFFYKTPVGELISRVTNDAEVVASYYEKGVA